MLYKTTERALKEIEKTKKSLEEKLDDILKENVMAKTLFESLILQLDYISKKIKDAIRQ